MKSWIVNVIIYPTVEILELSLFCSSSTKSWKQTSKQFTGLDLAEAFLLYLTISSDLFGGIWINYWWRTVCKSNRNLNIPRLPYLISLENKKDQKLTPLKWVQLMSGSSIHLSDFHICWNTSFCVWLTSFYRFCGYSRCSVRVIVGIWGIFGVSGIGKASLKDVTHKSSIVLGQGLTKQF